MVENLPLATAVGSDCQSDGTSAFSGQVDWRMVSNYEAQMTADGSVFVLRVKGSFGVPDWSTVYVNSCTGDPDLGGWTTFVGGTGP